MRVHQNFWLGTTGQQLRALGTDHLLLGLYLMTNPHVNLYGLYYLPLQTIQAETGIGRQCATVLRAIGDTGFARYQYAWVYIPNMLRYQMGNFAPNDNRVRAVTRWYDHLPSTCPFLSSFWDDYSGVLPLGVRRGVAEPAPAGTVVRDSSALAAVGAPAPPAIDPNYALFLEWWDKYPKKAGKKAAWGEWLKIKPTREQVANWLVVLEQQCVSRQWLEEGGKYIPDPERYLKRGKYEDEIVTRPIVDTVQTGNFETLQGFLNERRRPREQRGDVRALHGAPGDRVQQDAGQAPSGSVLGEPSGRAEPRPSGGNGQVVEGTSDVPAHRPDSGVLRSGAASTGSARPAGADRRGTNVLLPGL